MHITEIVTLDRTNKPDHTLGLVGPRPSRLPVMVSSLGKLLFVRLNNLTSDLFLRRHELRRLNPEGDLLPHESGRIPRVDARESLGCAIIQSESDEGFGWDILTAIPFPRE